MVGRLHAILNMTAMAARGGRLLLQLIVTCCERFEHGMKCFVLGYQRTCVPVQTVDDSPRIVLLNEDEASMRADSFQAKWGCPCGCIVKPEQPFPFTSHFRVARALT